MTDRIRILRFANCENLNDWLAAGWMFAAPYRSYWGTRMAFIIEWPCDCTPKLPIDPQAKKGYIDPIALSPLEQPPCAS